MYFARARDLVECAQDRGTGCFCFGDAGPIAEWESTNTDPTRDAVGGERFIGWDSGVFG